MPSTITEISVGGTTYKIVDDTSGYIKSAGVVSVSAGTGLTGGTITSSGTIALAAATSSAIGGVKVNGTKQTTAASTVTSTSGRTYALQLDNNNNAVVNVPWENTTYDLGSYATQSWVTTQIIGAIEGSY